MSNRFHVPLLALLFAAAPASAPTHAQVDSAARILPKYVTVDEPASQCDEALGLLDDVAADPAPDIHPTGKARKRLVRGVTLCRAGDDQGAQLLFQALAMIGVPVD